MAITIVEMQKVLANISLHRPKVELETRFSKHVDEGMREILRDMNKAFDQITDSINMLATTQANMAEPFQHIRVSDSNSGVSNDPDGNPVARSVLTTASEVAQEFNWLRAGGLRKYKVVLGPDDSVPTHFVVLNKNYANYGMQRYKADTDNIVKDRETVIRPCSADGLQIQFGYYKADGNVLKFWPVSLPDGAYLYLEQDLPKVNYD